VWFLGTSSAFSDIFFACVEPKLKRLEQGKSTLGFVNPLFYANPQCFNDISEGNNGYPAATVSAYRRKLGRSLTPF
jgi:hypothetical protein